MAEDKIKGQPMQPVTASASTAKLEKTPEKGNYTLAIPANLPGYEAKSSSSDFDPVKYTLGADDVIEVTVMRHPEFSGIFPINSEGKVQYKFVGDIDVKGLTKKQVEDKLVKALSSYLVKPEVSVTITEYKSKYVFVLGEVAQPGKYYIKSDTIAVRDAVVNAGLPTYSAAMRKCSLITPDKTGKVKNQSVNIYAILYIGDLRRNIEMHPGDVLYVPSTVMAKIIRVISPVATTVGLASSPAEDTSTAKSAAKAAFAL
jgi:polysaccharide export outer membrane protein